MSEGSKISGQTRIPVGEMARGIIRDIYPKLTAEQAEALNAGRPIPPSPDWEGSVGAQGASGTPGPMGSHGGSDPVVGPVGLSAILVFGEKARIKLARKAVNQFVRQLYGRKQLVIVNATDISVTTHDHPDITEISSSPGMIGDLRNVGVSACKYDWVLPCWDDDDYYNEARLAFQALYLKHEHACCLSTQIRANINSGAVFAHTDQGGIPNTMIVPRAGLQFASANMSEDSAFLADNYADRTVVVDNSVFPLSGLSVAVFHGHNVMPEALFMLDFADPSRAGRWSVSRDEAAFVAQVLGQFGLKTEAKQPTGLGKNNLP